MLPDRHIEVPAGQAVTTGYVPVHKVKMACRERMAIGDVEEAFRLLLRVRPSQPWPPPVGHWEGETFVIVDGRHTYIAALMLGYEHLFVAWLEEKGDGVH